MTIGELDFKVQKGERTFRGARHGRRIISQQTLEYEIDGQLFGDLLPQFQQNQESKSQSEYQQIVRTPFERIRQDVYADLKENESIQKDAFVAHIKSLIEQIRAAGWTPEKKLRHNGVCVISDPEASRLFPCQFKFITAFSVE